MDGTQGFLNYGFFGAPAFIWIEAGAAAFILFFALLLGRSVFRTRAAAFAQRSKAFGVAASAASKTSSVLLFALSARLAALFFGLPEGFIKYLHLALVLLLLVHIGVWGAWAIAFFIKDYNDRRAPDPAALTAVTALGVLARLALWTVVALLVLDNFGVNVSTLIAGLGIGGIAVALAAQSMLADLFASAAIVLDKPFIIGDFITVDGYMGAVEHIGIKTTRIRSLTGELIVFSNSDLMKSRIRNYQLMQERRVEFNIFICYDTPADKIRMVPGIIREIISDRKGVRPGRVHFFKYENFGLNFDAVYSVLSPDYGLYMDIQQEINLNIRERFSALGIQMAVVTQPCAAGKQSQA